MRFLSTLSRTALVVLAFATGRVVGDDFVTLYFGADFNQDADNAFVQGGFTVIDNANFVTGLNNQVGTLDMVQWRFSIQPGRPLPTSVYVKILKQKSDEPWRFQLVDQRVIVTREPTNDEKTAAAGDADTPAGYLADSYVEELKTFWDEPIALNTLTNGYSLRTPGVPYTAGDPPVPMSITEFEFVGFYFPDTMSQVSGYVNPNSEFIEWAMPGNFDWSDATPAPRNWSPPMRFTYAAGHSTASELTCANQKPISDFGTLNPGQPLLKNSQRSFIDNWRQYRSICSPPTEKTNNALGYLNNAQWVEGFVAREKHKDFFRFSVTAKKGPAGENGDPQFAGFQGQNFQFHGMADEVFNLISTPTFQMNGNFKYLSAGKCDYNETACFTHPGTYVDQLGFTIGDIRIKAIAGSHEMGLRAWMNDIEIHRAHTGNNNKIIFAINNSTTETGSFQYTQSGRLTLDLPQFHIEVINSDYFFNTEVSLKDQNVLRAGMKQVKLREKVLCASEGMKSSERMEHVESRMAKHYPRVPIHGLIGQTWRNALICDHPWVGDASDYVTSSLFSTDSAFNYYGTQ